MVDSNSDENSPSCWKYLFQGPRFQRSTNPRRMLLTRHESETPGGDTSVLLDNSSSNLEQENFSSSRSSEKSLPRPHSVPDISESLRTNRDVVIVQESVSLTENRSQNVQQSSLQSSNSSSGGILSFFGVRFHKSGTRHLDRSSGDRVHNSDSSSELKKTVEDRDHRYTKFPLTSPSQLSQSGIVNTIPLHTDSSFDATHIQLTPQTKTYAHPHKSPVPPVKGKIHGANSNKFLVHAVSSLGRKSKDSSTTNTTTDSSHKRNHHKRNKQLKVKSKSDNSLHKVTLNNLNINISSSSNSGGGGGGNRHHINSVLSPDSYPQGEQRLNSVQLGDHATIRLPWTGFQPQHLNNLSSVTTTRNHPNTHNNHLQDLDSVRYVECGVWSGNSSSSNSSSATTTTATSHSRNNVEKNPTSRRRSRSLERSINFRIFPVNHNNTVSNQFKHQNSTNNNNTNNSHAKLFIRESNSLERPSHRVRHSLSPSEQEVLFRNLTGCSQRLGEVPPILPPKKKTKPPPLGRLHSSAPNSSFSSVESSSDSNSPPSPPPRPKSTLRPESRPIVASFSSSSSSSSTTTITTTNTRPTKPVESRTTPTKNNNNNNNQHSNNSITNTSKDLNTKATMNFHRPVIPRTKSPDSQILSSPSVDTLDSGNESNSVNISGTSASGMSLEDARNSGFINKPSKGWIHSDQILSKKGVTYTVRYIGCLDVNTSMKSLDFDTRSLIAKECINQVCEAAGLKSVDKKRKTDRRVARILGLRARLDNAGTDVHLTITSTCLKLTSLDTGNVIATHDLPNISFASGGDATMLDFVAYVAKDSVIGRACFVLECGSGRAQDVITTVGQAFELRFKEYLQKRPSPTRNDDPDREYYNDLPGKAPPENSLGIVEKEANERESKRSGNGAKTTPTHLTLPTSSDNKDGISVQSINLIDFESPTPPAFVLQDRNLEAVLLSGGGAVSPQGLSGSNSGLISPGPSKDPFNMQPFGNSLPTSPTSPLTAEEQKLQLEAEPWFHGAISRAEAESLVRNDGDFLVRVGTVGQYVLTGLQSGTAKHLLLVDPEGVVRTKDREFDSVIHLIRYHFDNSLPIISADRKAVGCTGSMVCLKHGVPKRKEGGGA